MTKTILIDCDEVIANFSKMFQQVCVEQFGIEARVDDGKSWDFFDYPEVKAIKDDIWKYILGTRGLIRGLEKYEYTDDLLGRLRECGQVECVTSIVAGGYYADERVNWLIEEAGFGREDIHLSYKKFRIQGDVFIDDKPANVISWASNWWVPGEVLPVLWRPLRQSFILKDIPDHILQTGSVDELIQRIKDMP